MPSFLLSPVGRWLAGAVIVAALLGAAYVKGRSDCSANAELRKARAEVEYLSKRLAELDALAKRDAARAEADRQYIAELEARIDDTPENDNVCLPADAAGRVRNIR